MESDNGKKLLNRGGVAAAILAVIVGLVGLGVLGSLALDTAIYSKMVEKSGAARRAAGTPDALGKTGAAGGGKGAATPSGDKAAEAEEDSGPRKRRNRVYATGVVTTSPVSPEDDVFPSIPPSLDFFSSTDVYPLWVLADVFVDDLSHVQVGEAVKVRATSLPDKVFRGEIAFVGSSVDAETRTVKVGCAVVNDDDLLHPGMFATIEIPM